MAYNAEEYGPDALRKQKCSCCKWGVHNEGRVDIVKMAEESQRKNLRDYPPQEIDPFMDAQATREHFGRSSYTTLGTLVVSSGRTLVYDTHHYETDKQVDTPLGLRRVFAHDVYIHGYEVTMSERKKFLGIFPYENEVKKIEIVPQNEKDTILAEIAPSFKDVDSVRFVY